MASFFPSLGSKPEAETKFSGGSDTYGDPKALSTGVIDDLKAIGLGRLGGDVQTLLEVAFAKGKPVNDRELVMEKLIGITGSLPENSKTRHKLTCTIIDTLWDSLQHPPLSYLGDKFQYRTPDGSYNNVLQPDLGKAGTAYARTVRNAKKMHGIRPDPGFLFDTLMSREAGTFKENPAGISSVLFYHATIIIHDIFRTNRLDSNISDTSSYLDLAPLYGSNLEDQLKIRTMKNGMLKPDTFSEKRLIGQPPGVNVMLVFYSRFHNYCAEVLAKINEGGRFTLPPNADDAAIKKQDNDLFQTARLIVGGLYINICLHDYLRGLTNTHHSNSSWTLDPRIDIDKSFDGEGVPRGMGNQVSAEFNLLYRFHSTISLRDEKWLDEFLVSLFPNSKKPISEMSPQELLQGLVAYDQSIDQDPSKRTFGGLKRGPDGKFDDADLVRIMKESIEDPAGLFGARMVPKALRVVEILGILQARKWHCASLNEFREFFGLKKWETFEDINPDPEIADILHDLYDHPDMVELYPGLFLEDAKPRLDPGCGGCPPYTVGRAVFSDAVTLVRSDRFYTLDYTAATLTNWGITAVKQDYKTLGGSMFYRLIQRAVPGWFPFNSLHVMQPMFTRKMNETIAKEIGTIAQYTTDDPKPPPRPVVVTKHATLTKLLKDQKGFVVPWGVGLNKLFPGKKDYSSFMLCADQPANTAQRNLIGDLLYHPAEFKQLLSAFCESTATDFLKTAIFKAGKNIQQIDIIRDVAIPTNAHLVGDLFCLDLKTPENPKGSFTDAELYRHLLNVRVWGFENNDPGLAWNRRRYAQESATAMDESTKKVIRSIQISKAPKAFFDKVTSFMFTKEEGGTHTHQGSLRWYGRHIAEELLAAGQSVEQVSDVLWFTAVAAVGATVNVFAEVLEYFLRPGNEKIWAAVQGHVVADNEESNKALRSHVLEAQRLSSAQRIPRIATGATSDIDGQKFKPGDFVMCLVGQGCRDAEAFPDPLTFSLDRDPSTFIQYGFGPHECLGREISTVYVIQLVKVAARLKNLRPAPGAMGELKTIQLGTERLYLTSDWAELVFDPTTWKLHCDGYGTGIYRHPTKSAPPSASNLDAVAEVLKRQVETEAEHGVFDDYTKRVKILREKEHEAEQAVEDTAEHLAHGATAHLGAVTEPMGKDSNGATVNGTKGKEAGYPVKW